MHFITRHGIIPDALYNDYRIYRNALKNEILRMPMFVQLENGRISQHFNFFDIEEMTIARQQVEEFQNKKYLLEQLGYTQEEIKLSAKIHMLQEKFRTTYISNHPDESKISGSDNTIVAYYRARLALLNELEDVLEDAHEYYQGCFGDETKRIWEIKDFEERRKERNRLKAEGKFSPEYMSNC